MATKIKPFTVPVPERTPEVLAAAALGIRLLKKAKCTTWAEYLSGDTEAAALTRAAFQATEDQQALLERNTLALSGIRITPTVTIAYCPQCAGWTFIDGSAPSRCLISPGCEGKPVKAPNVNAANAG